MNAFKMIGVLIFFAALLPSQRSHAQSEVQSINQILTKLKNAPRGPQAELLMLDLFQQWDFEKTIHMVAALKQAAATPRLSSSARERAYHLLSLSKLRTGDPEASQLEFDRRGFINQWALSAPFDNEGGTGFDTLFSADDGAKEPVSIADPLWHIAPRELTSFGLVHVDSIMDPSANKCVYAASNVVSTENKKGRLMIGASGAVKAFWNGNIALTNNKYLGEDPDRDTAEVYIREGNNRLLVKVCSNETGKMSFYARITDSKFTTNGIKTSLNQSLLKLPVSTLGPKPKHLPGTLSKLLKRALSKNATANTKASAARYALLTSATHQGSNQFIDLAKSACERSKKTSHCLVWSALSPRSNDRSAAVAIALKGNPNSASAKLASAKLLSGKAQLIEALEQIESVLKHKPSHLRALIMRAEIKATQGLTMGALAEAKALAVKMPDIPAILSLIIDLAEQAGITSDALSYMTSATHSRWDNIYNHEVLARAALARGDLAALDEHIDAMQQLAHHDLSTMHEIAKLHEGAGRDSKAIAVLERATQTAPLNPEAHKAVGMLLIRDDQTKEGYSHLKQASILRPQDVNLADYLKYSNPSPLFETPFVVKPEHFLAMRKGDAAGGDADILVDSTVVNVFKSGLMSQFTQTVVEVHTRKAARDWRRYSIQWAPDTQRIKLIAARVFKPDGTVQSSTGRGTVSVAEPWYRLYYDLVAEVIELPPIEPGDVIEYSYRLDDTAHRNVYSKYFGDLVLVHGEHPKSLWRHVVISPSPMDLVVRKPEIKNLRTSITEKNGVKIRQYEVENVPSLLKENNMPGLTAGVAYLHISTYQSWNDLGNWYRRLIRNQLVADKALSERAKQLTRGLKSEAEKVAAIYNWVVTATRYVGLEFGIHGYKPYKAPLVAARGFGDCKDKATLLVTMLREVDISAESVLVRTRSLGSIDESPASLAAFNHAIAFVPSLNLWLDGTAEHHGTGDFPFEDQGALVLRLTDSDVKIEHTPVHNADKNTFMESIEMLIDPNGDSQIKTHAEANGAYFAPLLRRDLEAANSRRERFEILLVNKHPGAQLGDLEISDLENLEHPVAYDYSAHLPFYAKRSGSHLKIPVDLPLNLVNRYVKQRARVHELVVGPKRKLTRKTTMQLPKGYQVMKLPSSTSIKTEFGDLTLEINYSANKIMIKRIFSLNVHAVSPDKYEAFANFLGEVDDALDAHVTIERRSK